MADALRTAALEILRVLNSPASNSPGNKAKGPRWCRKGSPYLTYLTPSAKSRISPPANREGFTKLALTTEAALTRLELPSASYIQELATKSGCATELFKIGGTVEALASFIFRDAMKRDDIWGDGKYMQKEENSIIVERLSVCWNDGEWKNALVRMGYECRAVL
jgi:hypothetical protein